MFHIGKLEKKISMEKSIFKSVNIWFKITNWSTLIGQVLERSRQTLACNNLSSNNL